MQSLTTHALRQSLCLSWRHTQSHKITMTQNYTDTGAEKEVDTDTDTHAQSHTRTVTHTYDTLNTPTRNYTDLTSSYVTQI